MHKIMFRLIMVFALVAVSAIMGILVASKFSFEKTIETNATVTVDAVESIPVFEVTSYRVNSHNVEIFDQDKAVSIFGSGWKYGKTVLIYEYDAHSEFKIKNPPVPERTENDNIIRLKTPVVTVETSTDNFKHVICTSSGLANPSVTFEDLFARINESPKEMNLKVASEQNISYALDHFKLIYEKLYAVLGFEILWD